MKVLIWFLTFFMGAIINTIIGEAVGIKAGAILLYAVEFFIARKLCEIWDQRKGSKQSNTEDNPIEETVLCCPKCGRIVSSFGASKYTCSKCGHETEMVKTNVSAKDWISKNEDEKKKILKSFNIIGITTIDYVQNENGTIIDCKDSVPNTDNTLQAPPKIAYPTIEQKDVAILYCRNCGKKLDDDSLFCSYCGTKI